jgi:hypothetical protein
MERCGKQITSIDTSSYQTKFDVFFSYFYKSIVTFFFVYSFSPFSAFPSLTTDRLVILLLAVLCCFKGGIIIRRNSQSLRSFLLFLAMQVFITVYCVVLLFFIGIGTGVTLLSYSVNFVIFFGIGFFLISDFFVSIQETMRVLLFVTLFQCLVILLCMVNQPFCSFVDSTFNANSSWNYPLMRSGGYNAGIACITSTGVFQLCWGLIGCLYFLLHREGSRYFLFSFLYVFISIVMTLVARTGFFLSLICLIILGVATLSSRNKKLKQDFIICWAILFAFSVLGILLLISMGKFDSIFHRFSTLFTGGFSEFFIEYFSATNTVIPALSIETLFGTATVSGMSGNGVYINADGGFVRMYCALGLPLCVLYYLFFVYLLLRMTIKQKFRQSFFLNLTLFICLLLLEFKEMHFGAGTFVTLFFVASYLSEEALFDCSFDVKSASIYI